MFIVAERPVRVTRVFVASLKIELDDSRFGTGYHPNVSYVPFYNLSTTLLH